MIPILAWLAVASFGASLDLLPDEQAELAGRPATVEFLKARAEKLVKKWRAEPEKADRKQALLLYWYRGPLLTEADRAFLKGLNPVELGRAPPQPGGGKPVAGPAGKVRAAPPGLVAELRAGLDLINHGSQAEADALNLALERMLESPTAQTLARELIAQKVRFRVEFRDVPNTTVIDEGGQKVLLGSGGSLDMDHVPPLVTLNKNYLKTDPAYINRELPDTLGHELLGHGLQNVKARKAGVGGTFDHYYNDEAGAGLVGWIIQAERGFHPDNGHMHRIVYDPAAYHRELKINLPYYAGTFSPAEMNDVVGVLQKRLKAAQSEKIRVKRDHIDGYATWGKIAGHLNVDHKIPKPRFKEVEAEIDEQINVIGPGRAKDMDEIIAYIRTLIAHYKTPDGQKEIAAMKADAKKPFFAEQEKLVNARRAHLRKLLESGMLVLQLPEIVVIAPRLPAGASTAPPPPATDLSPLTWGEFTKLYIDDRKKYPTHYAGIN